MDFAPCWDIFNDTEQMLLIDNRSITAVLDSFGKESSHEERENRTKSAVALDNGTKFSFFFLENVSLREKTGMRLLLPPGAGAQFGRGTVPSDPRGKFKGLSQHPRVNKTPKYRLEKYRR